MIRVKVRIRYCYIPYMGKFKAKISFFLPTNGEGALLRFLQSPFRFIDNPLQDMWGYIEKNVRRRTYDVYAERCEELERKVKKDLKEKIAFLKKIAKENRENFRKVEGKEVEKTYLI